MNLPKGWVAVTAAEACDIVQSGGTPKSGFQTVAGIPFLKVYNIVNQAVAFEDRPQFVPKEVHQSELRKSFALPGDVLMNIVGPPLGKVAIIPSEYPEWNLNQAITLFRPGAATSTAWLYWYLIGGDSVQSVINETRGSTGQVNISLSQCRAFSIPLPPKAEQDRIVAKLDVLTARLARSRAETDKVYPLAARIRQAVLSEIFGTEVEPRWKMLGQTGLTVEAGKNLKCDERPPLCHEVGVVKVSAVSSEEFRFTESKTLPSNYSAPERDRIKVGDLLLARASGSLRLVGRVALVDKTPGNIFLSDKVLRLRLPPEVVDWVHWFLRSPVGRSQIEEAASGISMHNITQSSLMALRLPMPDAQSRNAALVRIKAAFARADRLEAEAARARALLDRLESAILAKAFRGELVPQDPNDEPASILLDRIRAERAAAPKPKRGRRAAADA